jgi:hypothetical protein
VELLVGPAWKSHSALGPITGREVAHLLVGLEGTKQEVEWMTSTLWNEWRKLGVAGDAVSEHQTHGLWTQLAQFPVEGNAPLVLKATLPPSRTVEFIQLLLSIDPTCSIQSHAGNGVVIARLLRASSASREPGGEFGS